MTEHAMKLSQAALFVCPLTHAPLTLHPARMEGDEVVEGVLTRADGVEYAITQGIPDFTAAGAAGERAAKAETLFDTLAQGYDEYHHLNFTTFGADETATRNAMIDRLELSPASRVLEVNAGTGRDSRLIAARLGPGGSLHAQDISGGMLALCREATAGSPCPVTLHKGDGCRLPYADGTFDAVYSFGGISLEAYADARASIGEMARVTRPGGKVVFGAPGIAPWLRDTYFARVLIDHKALYASHAPLAALPVTARDVRATWILSGAMYLVDFVVGEGEPYADFDYPIPGARGGTLRTRYEGRLEGVSPAVKAGVLAAARASGKSMHDWLDEVLGKAVRDTLEAKK